jgi:ribosome-binding factor A
MTHRIERVNNLIRREISELIQYELRDPRLESFVSVTEVSTSTDLRHAKIFVSSISGQQDKENILDVLNSASGFLRSELAGKIRLRRMPELSFHWDDSIEHGDKILRIIDNLNKEENTST